MKALFSGCFTFICMVFLLAYCIQYPALFWGIAMVFVVVIILGYREGVRRSKLNKPAGSGPVYKMPPASEDNDEGDIRHHYGYDGAPHSISSPETIQNETLSLGDEEDEER